MDNDREDLRSDSSDSGDEKLALPSLEEVRTALLELRSLGDRECYQALLDGTGPRDLGLLCARYVRDHAYFVHLPGLVDVTAMYLAIDAVEYEPTEPFAPWFDDRVERALGILLVRDERDEADQKPLTEPLQERLEQVKVCLGMELRHVRRAAITLNRMEERSRLCVHRMMFENMPEIPFVRSSGIDFHECRKRLRAAILLLNRVANDEWVQP